MADTLRGLAFALLLGALVHFAAGCGEPRPMLTPPPDVGPRESCLPGPLPSGCDGGLDAGDDEGDAGELLDAGVEPDAFEPVDAGTDAGELLDAGVEPDAFEPVDAGTDAPPVMCPPGLTFCAPDGCVDITTDERHCWGCGNVCAPPTFCYLDGRCGF